MNRTANMLPIVLTLVAAVVWPCVARGQVDEQTGPAAEEPAATEPSDTPPPADIPIAPDEAEATEAMQDMLGDREPSPVIEPVRTPGSTPVATPGFGATAAATTEIDPAVLGVAPGQDPPPLLREGEFVVNRRGRLIRSAETGQPLFVFEADNSQTPELPMILQPCRLLETMEDTVQRRGDGTVFILSGQVHTYRGANYLTPTMMKIAVDTGNLTN